MQPGDRLPKPIKKRTVVKRTKPGQGACRKEVAVSEEGYPLELEVENLFAIEPTNMVGVLVKDRCH